MSDMFPSDWVEDTYFGGLISPNEVFWQDANRLGLFGLDVPMTKAETIMRREEALRLRHPLFAIPSDSFDWAALRDLRRGWAY